MSDRTEEGQAALQRLATLEVELEALVAAVGEATARLRGEIIRAREAVAQLEDRALHPPLEPAASPQDESARLIALDLVMRGTPREDAVRALRADFPGVNAERIVDEAATPGV